MAVVQVGISPVIYKNIYVHTHAVWEIVYNFEGEGITRIGDCEYAFGPGTVICQPPGIDHTKSLEKGFRDVFLQTTAFPLGDTLPANQVLVFEDDSENSFAILIFLTHRTFHKQEHNYRLLLEALYDAMYQLR